MLSLQNRICSPRCGCRPAPMGRSFRLSMGRTALQRRLIWAAISGHPPHQRNKVGGKGLGSGGGNAVSNTTYTYQTAVAMALVPGPIQNIHNVWDTKGRLTLVTAHVQFTVPGGGGGRHGHSAGQWHLSFPIGRWTR